MQAKRLALLSTIILPPQFLKIAANETHRTYHIRDLKCSENAWLIFNTDKVVKVLRPYDDSRYSLKERQNRHKCLLEGLEWNRKFTKGVHLGVARFCDLNPTNRTITLGEMLACPKLSDLDPGAEYVLVMNKLPKQYRLDCLLAEGNSFSHQYCEQMLTQFLWNIHANQSFPVIPINSVEDWGSVPQIERKLKYNLEIVEKPGDDVRMKSVPQTEEYKHLLSTSKLLRNALLPIFSRETYQQYFQQRREKQQIKRCHGDLKARNIWIFPPTGNDKGSLWEGVCALDAIDFNSDFCVIDTLSDFAMLVADIRVRTNQQNLAQRMIESYLRHTNQLDQADRFVLAYYLVEKAFIGACVSIMYDDQPALGRRYLQVTMSYLDELKNMIRDERR